MKTIPNRRASMAAWLAVGLTVLAGACSETPVKQAAQAKPDMLAAYQAAARSTLGDSAQVILSGDLARNGHIQLLVVDRLPKMSGNVVSGLPVSRAAILEKGANDWHEIFLADEHLENPKGFLAGTPRAPVGAWRLQYDEQTGGLAMYFTPLQQSPGERSPTIEVRWNRAARRYQSLDRNSKRFLSEASSLGPTPEFQMKQ